MPNSGVINAVNGSGANVIPSAGSFVSVGSGPGSSSVTIQVNNLSGAVNLRVGTSLDGSGFNIQGDNTILSSAGVLGAITANGSYTVTVGAGTVYLFNSAGSGSCTVTLSSGLGSGNTPGASGGGSDTTIVGPKWTISTNGQGVNVLAVKASAGTLGAFYVFSRSGAVSYAFIYDSLSASGTLVDVIAIYANGITEIGSEYYGPAGYDFATGIYIAISTSNTAYSAATAANYDIGSKAK